MCQYIHRSPDSCRPCFERGRVTALRRRQERVQRGLEIALLGDPAFDGADLVGALDAVADLTRDLRIPAGVPQRDLARPRPAPSRRSRAYSPIVWSIRSRSPWPSTCTSALSTSDSSSSRMVSPGSAQTASTSARVHPPTNTAMRRNRRCSDSVSSEWLQSIVARSVCCRSGVSRGPDVSTSRRGRAARAAPPETGAAAGRQRARAPAADRPGGGRPPRRLRRSAASARTAVRRSGSLDEERDGRVVRSDSIELVGRGGSASGASGYSRSAAIRSGVRLVIDDPQPWAALDQPGDLRSSAPRPARGCPGAGAPSCHR